MENATRLILVRHGETEWNAAGRFQGHLDSPLTPQGIRRAAYLAARLKLICFTALYSSDLGRARQTAAIIARETGHEVKIDSRLRERALGVFQSIDRTEIMARFPAEWELYRHGGADYAVPGGESLAERFNVNLLALTEIARAHPSQTVVVVTHGGLLSGMFRYVVGLPLDARRAFSLSNTSYNSFLWNAEGWQLETWGDHSHFPPGPPAQPPK
jgi:2,3-bisphosphoglycerate-dependent phosphoglycerate mutase